MPKTQKKQETSQPSRLTALPSLDNLEKKPQKPAKEKKIPRLYRFTESNDKNLAREAYWSRKDKTTLLNEILERHYQENPQEPKPNE